MRPMTLLTLAAALAVPGAVTAQMAEGAPEAAASRIGPKLQVQPEEINFGQIDDSTVVEQTVTLTNVGDEILRIPEEEGVKGSCGCTVPKLDKYELAPGESIDLNVRFDPRNRTGNQNKTVSIQGQGDFTTTVIPVNAFVMQRVQVVEGIVQFGMVDQGDTQSIEIHVRGMAPDFQVTEATPSREDMFTAEILGTEMVQREDPVTGELTEVGETKIRIDLLPNAAIGRTNAELKIETNDPIATSKEVRMLAVINGDVRIDPAVVRLGALEPGASFEHEVTIYSNKDRSFNVEKVLFVTSDLSEADKALISVTHEPLPAEDGRVGHIVRFAGDVSDTMRIIRGKVVVVTDAPGQRVISANVAGVVRGQ